MTTSRRVETAQQTLEDLARVLSVSTVGSESRTLLGHSLVRLQDARPGLPSAQSFDGDRVQSSTSGNPPKGFDQPDPTNGDRVLVDTLLRRLRADSDALVRLVSRWQPREASPRDRTLSAVNEREEPDCEHCRTIGKWAPARQGAAATRCNGNLEEPMSLCAFCYRFCLDTGALPTRKQLEDHHNGQRVRRNVPPQGMSA